MKQNLDLYLDYDCSEAQLVKKWKNGIDIITRVFTSKRKYMPTLFVDRVVGTRRGFHIYCILQLDESPMSKEIGRLVVLRFQDVMGSDSTRGLFDVLRVLRKEKEFNLLFDWKNGFLTSDNIRIRNKLQRMCYYMLV